MVWHQDGRVVCDHCHRTYRGQIWRKAEFRGTGVVWMSRINQINRCFCSFCLLTQDCGCLCFRRKCDVFISRLFFSREYIDFKTVGMSLFVASVTFSFRELCLPESISISFAAGGWSRCPNDMPLPRVANRSADCSGRMQPEA